jgi:hypothetical protein
MSRSSAEIDVPLAESSATRSGPSCDRPLILDPLIASISLLTDDELRSMKNADLRSVVGLAYHSLDLEPTVPVRATRDRLLAAALAARELCRREQALVQFNLNEDASE